MTAIREPKKRSAKEIIPPLLLGILGAGAAVALLLLEPGFELLDMICLLVVVASATLGYTQRSLRAILSAVFLYFGSGVAGTFYVVTAPYIGAPLGGEQSRDNQALAFFVLTIVIWVALEAISRGLFRDMSLPQIGVLDNLGGLFIYLVAGIIFATLVFNTVGYTDWGNYAHDSARLRPQFRQALRIYYPAQSFLFRDEMPFIYQYDFEPPSQP